MEISTASIRLWAFNQQSISELQVEEQALQQLEHIPVLIELAAQENCPKQEYIQTLLEDYMQQSFLQHKHEQLDALHTILENSKSFLITQWLVLWFINFEYIYNIFKSPQRITDAACDKIAQDLLIGGDSQRNLTILTPLEDGTRGYTVTKAQSKQYFYINPTNGQWKLSKYGPLLKFED